MTTTLTARRLLTGIGVVEYPVVEVGPDGRIASISSDPTALATRHDTLAAAFLDVHTHGAMGHDVMSASPTQLSEMQRFLARRGVAHYLPTTVTAPVDATLHSLEALADAIESSPREAEALPVAIHLEGPFLSHLRRCVHPQHLLQPPSIELFNRFQQAARGHIALVTIAPEPNAAHPGQTPESALELIAHAARSGVRVSLGHTNATAAEALAAADAGAVSATHTFTAMRPLDHRDPGVLGVALSDDNLWSELICDGVHVAPPVVQLWFRAKAAAKRILVTDAMSAAGMPDGDYSLAGLPVTVANGRAFLQDDMTAGKTTLAGSVLTMDTAVANLQAFAGATLAEAVSCAAHHPAALLGREHLTRINAGSLANLNRFNERGKLIETFVHGVAVRPN
jgi:N-acetylglucosamine-6-phosphate deacetylase